MAMPKEPRQAMINMMYLVLTAMLALNVSSEVLNAFRNIERGISETNYTLAQGTSEIMAGFEKRAKEDSTTATQELYERAKSAREEAQKLYDRVESMKRQMILVSGGTNDTVDENGKLITDRTGKVIYDPKNPKDTHGPTFYLLGEDRKDQELQAEINRVRNLFLQFFPPELQEAEKASMTLKADDPEDDPDGRDWGHYVFGEVPIMAAVALLSKIQNDIRTTERKTLTYLKSLVGIDIVEFDQLKARAIPHKPVLNKGEKYEADIFVSATSSAFSPKVYIGQLDRSKAYGENGELLSEIEGLDAPPIIGNPTTLDEDPENPGMVKYETTTSAVGPKTYEGVIEVYNVKNNTKKFYPFKSEYLVTSPIAVVSPTAMNVLYIGVDNPLDISVPGYPSEKVIASIQSGTLTGGNGQFNAKVEKSGETSVVVSVRLDEGGTKQIGSKPFRVKRIPNPDVLCGNRPGPVITSGELRAFPGLIAKSDDFPFDVNYNITGFKVTVKKSGSNNLIEKDNQGKIFAADVKALLSTLRPGDRVWFDEIKVRLPDKTTRQANLSFKVIGG